MNCNQLQNKINQVIHGTLALEQILEQIELKIDLRQPQELHGIIKQIIKGCNSKSSSIADNTTKIIKQIINNPTDELFEQFEGHDFQTALMYTLRGTTRFGNKFSMHRETWKKVEQRVLGFYAFWFNQRALKEGKMDNILKNYKFLESYNISFPVIQSSSIIIDDRSNSPKNTNTNINSDNKLCLESQIESLQTFLQEYQKMVNDGIDESIVDTIQFKIKQKLIYALNNVLLLDNTQNKYNKAMQYNKRFNSLIQKLVQQKGKPSKNKKHVSSKIITIPLTQQNEQITVVPQTKRSGIRSLLKSTISFLSSQPNTKDVETKQKIISKLDQTIGDLVKYFDQHQQIQIQNIQEMTRSSLY